MSYAEDRRDLEVLCEAWDVPESTLVWSIMHDWLCKQRAASSELGSEVRGQLKAAIELAMRDRELGPWVRAAVREIEE